MSEVRDQQEQLPAIPAEFVNDFTSAACKRFFPCTRVSAVACGRVVDRKGDGSPCSCSCHVGLAALVERIEKQRDDNPAASFKDDDK